jgi:hypothetical protein
MDVVPTGAVIKPEIVVLGTVVITADELIVVMPLQGDADGTRGEGATMSGLAPGGPASVAVKGIVASLNVGAVVVARPGIGATSAPMPRASSVSWVPTAGLQPPVAIDGPKEGFGGIVAPGSGCGSLAPDSAMALLASIEKSGVAGQVASDPMACVESVVPVPGIRGIAPSAPAMGEGMVPGTAAPGAGIVPAMPGGDGARMAGATMPGTGIPTPGLDPICCAELALQANNAIAAVMTTKFRIGASPV